MKTIRIPLVLGSVLASLALAGSGASALPSAQARGDGGLVTQVAAKRAHKKPVKHAHPDRKSEKKAAKKPFAKKGPLKAAGETKAPKKSVKKIVKKHPAKKHLHKKGDKA